MNINNFFKNLFQTLFTYVEIHFQFQQIFRLTAIYKSQILRQNLIENETSQSGFHIPAYYLAIRRRALYARRNSGMQR